eukprot:TRINITY_DN50612_c0_g1_i1.p1 TRINITY_DN50612_c0_g1~~TRINITY_DN50612_c0_g1_i1.p1  ORF type:complete len:531 (+),score=53.03 TRINITY_DN50612_c0_g1_i1:127-1593(+)
MAAASTEQTICRQESVRASLRFDGFKAAWEARKPGENIRSTEFCFGDWHMHLTLGSPPAEKEKVSVFLSAAKSGALPLVIQSCTVKCANIEGSWREPEAVRFKPKWCEWEERKRTACTYGFSQFCDERELLAQAERNEDVLFLEARLTAATEADFPDCLRVPARVSEASWSNPCLVTLKSKDGTSVTIPKAVLGYHSAALAAACESNMAEGQSHIIEMPDIAKQVLDDLHACFLHGGLPAAICTSLTRLLELLVLANKYVITSLEDALTYHVCVGISRDQVPQVLLTADRHGLVRLLHAAFMFTTRSEENFKAVIEHELFNDFSADLLRLVTAFSSVIVKQESDTLPDNLQWGAVPQEFDGNSNWEILSQQELRRACLERFLGTAGTTAEMVYRLTSHTSADNGMSYLASVLSCGRLRRSVAFACHANGHCHRHVLRQGAFVDSGSFSARTCFRRLRAWLLGTKARCCDRLIARMHAFQQDALRRFSI